MKNMKGFENKDGEEKKRRNMDHRMKEMSNNISVKLLQKSSPIDQKWVHQ